jgi:hypothetical protein
MMIFSFFILVPCGPARNVCGVCAEGRRGEWWSSGTWSSTPPPPFSSAQAGSASLGANFSKLMTLLALEFIFNFVLISSEKMQRFSVCSRNHKPKFECDSLLLDQSAFVFLL